MNEASEPSPGAAGVSKRAARGGLRVLTFLYPPPYFLCLEEEDARSNPRGE